VFDACSFGCDFEVGIIMLMVLNDIYMAIPIPSAFMFLE
jgi:hypothetical protein